jgi:hypothetical protein
MRRPDSLPSLLLSVGVVAATARAPFAPALAPVVDDAALAALPEPIRPLYAPLDGQAGKHALQIDGIDNHPAVQGLKANRDKALGDFTRTKAELEKFRNVDPEKYATLLAAAEQAEEEKQRAAGNFDALKAQLIEQHTKALTAAQGEGAKYQTALDKVLRSDALRAAFALEDVRGNADLLMPHAITQTAVAEVGGEFVVQVVDAKGNPRIKDASGSPMTLKDLLLEMRADARYAEGFKGTGMSGGDAPGGAGGPPATGGLKGDALRNASTGEKVAALKALVAKHGGDTVKAQREYTQLMNAK